MFKLIAIILAVIIIRKLIDLFKRRSIGAVPFFISLAIIIATVFFVIYPESSNFIANALGIGRGVDSMFFLAIILLFLFSFKLYRKIDQLDQKITELAINISKAIHKNNPAE